MTTIAQLSPVVVTSTPEQINPLVKVYLQQKTPAEQQTQTVTSIKTDTVVISRAAVEMAAKTSKDVKLKSGNLSWVRVPPWKPYLDTFA
jgi:hypothetical protein